MGTGVLEIGSQLELDPVHPAVVAAFSSQRRRLLAITRDLRDDEWRKPSRCELWDVQGLVLHVLGATDACRTSLTGERAVFGGSFDPNSTPNLFVESRRGEPADVTIAGLAAAITVAETVIAAQPSRSPVPAMTAVWGAPIDWRLFVTHFFWDGWMHERDLLVPLGREHQSPDSERRLAAAYGLHTAGIMAGLLGNPLDLELHLGGRGGGRFHLVADGADVVVTVRPAGSGAGPVLGDAAEVTDALAGRGSELASVLDAPAETVRVLSQIAAFMRGQTGDPRVQPA